LFPPLARRRRTGLPSTTDDAIPDGAGAMGAGLSLRGEGAHFFGWPLHSFLASIAVQIGRAQRPARGRQSTAP